MPLTNKMLLLATSSTEPKYYKVSVFLCVLISLYCIYWLFAIDDFYEILLLCYITPSNTKMISALKSTEQQSSSILKNFIFLHISIKCCILFKVTEWLSVWIYLTSVLHFQHHFKLHVMFHFFFFCLPKVHLVLLWRVCVCWVFVW